VSKGIRVVQARLGAGGIEAEGDTEEIMRTVMSGTIVLLKGVFPAGECAALRDLTFEWGRSQSALRQSEFYSHTRENHFCREQGVSRVQKTLHFYHSHNFNDYRRGLPDALTQGLGRFCKPLVEFYNCLVGADTGFEGDRRIHPQVIHYPAGAGHFAKHVHELEPQRVGVITSLSSRGTDHRVGGAGFEVDGDLVDTSPHHDTGDVVLFRYDLPHWVSAVDIEDAYDPASARGRWTLVIPYY
jgi:hypothetical protein